MRVAAHAEEPNPPTVSVVIPTLNEEQSLRQTLASLQRLAGHWEVIVADSSSVDRTVEIARAAGARVVAEAPAGRGAALNAGAAAASGDILLFLHADSWLPSTAYASITAVLADPAVAATGFRLRMDRDEWRFRILSSIATARFRVQRTFFGDQAIAVRRRDFERVGGYREVLLMEDVELSRRLRERGRLELLPGHVTTSARRFERGGVLRTLARMSLLQMAYAAGIPGDRLQRWYGPGRARAVPPAERIALAGARLEDERGTAVDLSSVADQRPVLLVFLRWLG